jgi:hypothetical protein
MIEQLTILRVAANDPHAEVGEEGKYGECEDGGHWNDFNGELENCASRVQEVDSVSMGFCLIPLPRHDGEPSGYATRYEVRSSGLKTHSSIHFNLS